MEDDAGDQKPKILPSCEVQDVTDLLKFGQIVNLCRVAGAQDALVDLSYIWVLEVVWSFIIFIFSTALEAAKAAGPGD